MAADPNTAVFFPATLLFLIRPLSAAIRASHLLWATAFPVLAFAALRKLGLPRGPAAVAAFALGVSGPAMTLASLPTTAWAVAFFLPLLAAAALPVRRRAAPGIAILFGLAVLAGEPAIAGEIAILVAIFILLERRGGAKAAASGLVAGAAVALPQILAAAELLPATVRRGGLAVASGAAFYSVRPLRFLAFVWPGLFGDVHSPHGGGFWGADFFDAGTPYISTLAVGTAALALLPAAARHRRGRSFLVLAGISSLLSLGRFFPGGGRLLALPGLSLVRYPEKWLFFAAAAAIAAAGFGLDRVRAGDRIALRRLVIAAAAIAIVSGAAWLGLRLASPRSAWSTLVESRITSDRFGVARAEIVDAVGREFSTAFSICGALLLATAGFARRPRRLAAAVSLVLLADLLPRTWNSVPLAPASQFDRPPDAVRAVAAAGGRFYFNDEAYIADDPLRPMRPAIWGVRYAGNNDIDRFSPRRSFLFGRAVASLPFSDPRKPALLRLADVHAVSATGAPVSRDLVPWFRTESWSVFRLAGGSRFRLFASAVPASSEESARRLLLDPSRDPLATLVLEGSTVASGGGAPAEIRTIRRRADREEIDVRSGGGWLFRSETYDPHWRAEVDGRRAPLVPADYAFQAVPIPPGDHRIEFAYSDPLLAAAMAVSLATLAAIAWRLRRRDDG
ncbi:MAG TPA: YfhO family protein, partial [Thermoanaerobaculia bacterium]|nr:YfhO family protein [Thermoanaerobaculia bacterium]